MKPLLWYSLLRLLLLVVVGAFAFALGMRGLLLLATAFLASGVLSYFVLRDQRLRLGTEVGGVFGRINARIDAAAAAEDVDVDVRQQPGPQPGPTGAASAADNGGPQSTPA